VIRGLLGWIAGGPFGAEQGLQLKHELAGPGFRATTNRKHLRGLVSLAHLGVSRGESLARGGVLLRAGAVIHYFLEVGDRVVVFGVIELAQLAFAVGAAKRIFAYQVGIGHRQHAGGEAVDRLVEQFLRLLGVIVEQSGRSREPQPGKRICGAQCQLLGLVVVALPAVVDLRDALVFLLRIGRVHPIEHRFELAVDRYQRTLVHLAARSELGEGSLGVVEAGDHLVGGRFVGLGGRELAREARKLAAERSDALSGGDAGGEGEREKGG